VDLIRYVYIFEKKRILPFSTEFDVYITKSNYIHTICMPSCAVIIWGAMILVYLRHKKNEFSFLKTDVGLALAGRTAKPSEKDRLG
jgi:hypothetical protein